MNKIAIGLLSVLCYVILPIGYVLIGFPIFFRGLDNLDYVTLGFGMITLSLVALIPYFWTKELETMYRRTKYGRKKVDSS